MRPTIALFGCGKLPISCDSSLLVRTISRGFTRVWNEATCGRTRATITISSSAALPARSPMPLTVHSTCPAPASIAASVFATARPRSSWQWALRTTLSVSGTRSRTARNSAADSAGVVYPTATGRLIGGALAGSPPRRYGRGNRNGPRRVFPPRIRRPNVAAGAVAAARAR